MINDVEHGQLDRVRERLSKSDLGALPKESIYNSLGRSEECLRNATQETQFLACAIMAQAIAFTDVAVDNKNVIREEITLGIKAHVQKCTGADSETPGEGRQNVDFIVKAQRTLLSAPMALSLFLSVCVLKFGDKIFERVCNGLGI